MKKNMIRLIMGIVLASAVKEFVHVNIGTFPEVYPTFINVMAYVTSPLGAALGAGIIYYLLGDRLPTNSKFLKGILLGLLVAFVEGRWIRDPIMNMLLSIPYSKILLHEAQMLLPNLAMAIIIALIVKPKYDDASNT